MAKSLKKELTDISELVAIVGLNRRDVVAVSIYGCGEPTIQVDPRELARISKLLSIPRKNIDFATSERGNLHIQFKARGILWAAVVLRDRVAEFHAILSAQAPRLTVQPKRLVAPLRRLLFEDSGTT